MLNFFVKPAYEALGVKVPSTQQEQPREPLTVERIQSRADALCNDLKIGPVWLRQWGENAPKELQARLKKAQTEIAVLEEVIEDLTLPESVCQEALRQICRIQQKIDRAENTLSVARYG